MSEPLVVPFVLIRDPWTDACKTCIKWWTKLFVSEMPKPFWVGPYWFAVFWNVGNALLTLSALQGFDQFTRLKAAHGQSIYMRKFCQRQNVLMRGQHVISPAVTVNAATGRLPPVAQQACIILDLLLEGCEIHLLAWELDFKNGRLHLG